MNPRRRAGEVCCVGVPGAGEVGCAGVPLPQRGADAGYLLLGCLMRRDEKELRLFL